MRSRFADIAEKAFSDHRDLLGATADTCLDELSCLADCCTDALQRGGKILLFGNGGSAADAQHIATELTVRYLVNRKAMAAIALTTDTSVLTAASNDLGFEYVFQRQVEALGRSGDVAIGISTSGSSPNVFKALDTARELGLVATALAGNEGGALGKVADPLLIGPPRIPHGFRKCTFCCCIFFATSWSSVSLSEPSALIDVVDRLSRARVLCIGDIMLDRFIYGVGERISPESPVPVLRVTHERAGLGGAGNVAHNIATLGADVAVVGAVGDDVSGEQISTLLSDLPGCEFALTTDATRATTVKIRCIGAHQQIVRIDHDPDTPLAQSAEESLLNHAMERMNDCDVVVLSDYGKGVLGTVMLERLLKAARELGKPTVLDPKGPDFAPYRGASIITPNLKELHDASRCPVETDEEVEAAARYTMDRNGIDAVLVTRSEKGMTLVEPHTGCHHIPTVAQQIYDVSGAGDTVAAVLATACGAGLDLVQAVRLANIAAGLVVSKLGTAVVSYLELASAVRSNDQSTLWGKLLTSAQLQEQVQQWRSCQERIGFTNGCFDLLHPGHVKLLNEARGKCDRLIVGLNNDDSVRRLKGQTRPIQDEISRATILASFS